MKATLQLKISSIDATVLSFYLVFLKNSLKRLNIECTFTSLPIETKKITLLKSPHVHKKAREQFQIKKFTKLVTIKNLNLSKYILFIFLNKPKFIKIKVKKM
jgi:small subunit ribosomal protein S10